MSTMAIPLTETGDISNSEKIRWTMNKGTPYVPSAVIYDGLLYFNQSNQAILRCVDSKSGELVFGPQRVNGMSNIYSSPVAAAGRVYFVGRGGTTVVLNHSRSFEPIATNELNERFDASPAIAGDELFLRGAKHVYCIAED